MGLGAFTRRSRRLLAITPLACILGAVPATAIARTGLVRDPHSGSVIGTSGGSGSSSPSTPTSTSPTTTLTPAPVVKLATAVTATGDGISISVAGSGSTKHPLTISGTAPETAAGGRIAIETAPTSTSHSWTQVATALIAPTGSFSAIWVPSSSGEVAIRAVLAAGLSAALVQTETGANGAGALPASNTTTTASTTDTTSALLIPIFKSAIATMYGPGLWNRHTFCGERLRKTTLGVASRTLKCGTKVEISFKGREITVPVIDRGPFANNATWDLTWATGEALGMKATSTIGTLT
jgi:peptidoglycan lytic transglycosylase